MKELTIRRANQTDAIAIAAILQNLGWFAHLNTETPEQVIEQIEQHIRLCHVDHSHSVYVAEKVDCHAEYDTDRGIDHTVLGYVTVHWLPYLFLSSPEGYVSELFVQRNYCGQGIGQRLLMTVVAEASDRGCSRLMLVNSKDRESYQRQFYIKQGWRERENIANFVYLL